MVLSMERWKGKVAVVTGASEGIGAAVSKALVKHGVIVVGFARRKEKIEELAKTVSDPSKLHAVKVDVTKEQDIVDGFRWTKKNLGPVHILVNNAGRAAEGDLSDVSGEKVKKVLDTNVFGLTIATREALKSFEENGVDGHIIHINSVSGHTAFYCPNFNVYPASKFAVTALTETLRQELIAKKSRTKVTSISPGWVKTQFVANSESPDNKRLKAKIEIEPILEAEDIVDAAVYVLSTPAHVQVHEVLLHPVGGRI